MPSGGIQESVAPGTRRTTSVAPTANTARSELRTDNALDPRTTRPRSCSFVFSHARISSILPSTNKARRRLSFGGSIARPLIHKLVKPIKVARSRFSNEVRRYELFVAEAEPQMRAAHASVPRKPNAAVRIEVSRLNLVYRCFD